MRTALVLAVLALTGCEQHDVTLEEATLAASLADRIVTDPGAANATLEQEGMDREQYETLLYEIAADPEATRRYLEARREVFRNPYAPQRLGPSGQGTF